VVPYTEGSVCFTDAVRSRGTLAVVRSSKKAERRITSYDGLVDFRENVRKEVLVASLLAAGGVPVPRVLAWHAASAAFDEPSWMVSDFIAHTPITALTPAAQYQLGGITRAIHAITPTEANAAALTPGADWGRCIVERIMRRLERARRYIPLPPSAALEPLLEQAVSGRNPAATRLLHLDMRPPNLAVVDGRIVAIFDYANALCGDPYFELARIRECGLLTPAFVDGYGLTWDEVRRQEPLLCAYGLDLTTLLVIVTMEEFDDRGLRSRPDAGRSRSMA
jgi:aminoglycoside phosphotransferase (APT) family kinase protein